MRQKPPPDLALLSAVLILLCFGIIMVFSSSSVSALSLKKDSLYFLKRQVIFSLIGLLGMGYFSKLDYWHIKRYEKSIVITMFILLVIVLIPGIGMKLNDARRWIGFGSFTIQPSELAKLGMVIYLASGLERKGEKVRSFFGGVFPFLLVMTITCGLIVIEPHLSATVLIGATTFIMLFVSGSNMAHMFSLGGAGALTVAALTFSKGYRMSRYTAFVDPWKDAQGKGFQIIQSLYALGSGGLIGVGLGQSRQKYFYLPEPQNDFIFAIIGEELGFLGAAFVILMFMFFIWRGYNAALTAPDQFGKLLATGITTLIALQFLINISVATASMPVTGMPLPFISYGGTSLTITLAQVGILLNISRYSEAK